MEIKKAKAVIVELSAEELACLALDQAKEDLELGDEVALGDYEWDVTTELNDKGTLDGITVTLYQDDE